jgi:hypothetical protein
MTLLLAGCGGGSGGPEPAAGASSPGQGGYEKAVAQHVYSGTPRTPPDFYSEAPPAGATGPVATVHLKSADITPAANGPRYELCTDDSAQAIQWSELRPSFGGGYADMVDIRSDERLFEIVRVPRTDSSARLLQRVFRCSYLDRSTTDLDAASGPAGTVNRRPLDGAGLRTLSEYLWRFTTFNNADHVVLTSAATSATAGRIAHTIEMARLTRAAHSSECDRIDILRWTHSLDASTGALQRELETARSFGARRDGLGDVTICY